VRQCQDASIFPQYVNYYQNPIFSRGLWQTVNKVHRYMLLNCSKNRQGLEKSSYCRQLRLVSLTNGTSPHIDSNILTQSLPMQQARQSPLGNLCPKWPLKEESWKSLTLKKLDAYKSAKSSGAWGASSEVKAWIFEHKTHFYWKMLENHIQIIFFTNKLDGSIKHVIRDYNRPYYSILYWVHQF